MSYIIYYTYIKEVVDIMKKIISILIIFLSITLFSCQKETTIDFEIKTPESVLLGDNSYSGFSLSLTNGETISLEDSMFLDGTELFPYKEGKQTIKIKYQKITKTAEVNVVRRDFENVLLNDLEVKYTGEFISLTVSGDLPVDASVYYGEGNSFKEIGEYEITCVISHPYYNTLTLSAKLKIVGGDNNE